MVGDTVCGRSTVQSVPKDIMTELQRAQNQTKRRSFRSPQPACRGVHLADMSHRGPALHHLESS